MQQFRSTESKQLKVMADMADGDFSILVQGMPYTFSGIANLGRYADLLPAWIYRERQGEVK